MASMTASELGKYIGKTLQIVDQRTGSVYSAKIADVRESWGKLQVQMEDSVKWFEPNQREFNSMEVEWFND